MSLIVVEGPDGAGKSTLAEAIIDRLSRRHPGDTVDLWHRCAPPPGKHALDEYVLPLLSYQPATGHHIICDRWHVGEYVYPQVLGRATTMNTSVFAYTEAFLQSRGAVVVYVTPSADVIARNLDARVRRGEPLGESPPLTTVLHHYNVAHKISWATSYQLNNAFDAEMIAKAVVHLAETREQAATMCSKYVTYVGSSEPTDVLVGDVRRAGTASNRPAFMPYASTSGHYLFNALTLLSPAVERFGVINANDADDVVAFLSSCRATPRVVALGNPAHKTLGKLGIEHGTVPHPQWWRRFLHHFPGEYATSIKTALHTGADLRGQHPTNS